MSSVQKISIFVTNSLHTGRQFVRNNYIFPADGMTTSVNGFHGDFWTLQNFFHPFITEIDFRMKTTQFVNTPN